MSIITRTDVTAVKLCENCILAGIGSWMYIYDRKSAELLQKIRVLNGQKIYGFIYSNHYEILVFGGKQFTIVTVDNSHSKFMKSFEAIVCKDWLHSGVWVADGLVALLTAHNVIQQWNVSTRSLVSENISKENSILYSGFLLPIQEDILVFSGTVFSEVLVQRCGCDTVLQSLKGHKGVIFSVSCDLQKGVIVTTSDDRSVRIWQLNKSSFPPNSIEYWDNVDITCMHELYGHLARVMRHCITDSFVISIGEDSSICFWGYNGTLLRKVMAHQSACIWSLDVDAKSLVTGGGDAGVILHPLSMVTEYGQSKILDIDVTNAKKVVFTARRNIVIMTDKDELIYYDVSAGSTLVFDLNHESTYKLLSISSCKQIVAVVDMCGKLNVFIETCKGPASMRQIIDTKLEIGKILFMQWSGNRNLVFSSQDGIITVLSSRDSDTEIFANFVLPPSKERWLTSAAIDTGNNLVVVGDRCGTLHVYLAGRKNPLQSFKRLHGRYGPTSINIRRNKIITTGRDGTIKYFSVDNECEVKLMCSRNVEFQWVERFADKDERYVCGFQERVFVVYDTRNNSKLFEVSCGGGHRAWDLTRYIDTVHGAHEECIQYMYLKNSKINIQTFQLSKVVSSNIVSGTHSKEINCLNTHVIESHAPITFFISGGEDTTLRISSLGANEQFRDEVIFKRLSSIRTLKLCPVGSKLLAISAGGRAQICIKLVSFVKDDDKVTIETEELCEYLIRGNDKERKGNQTWRNCSVDFDPETRIMDVDAVEIVEGSGFLVVAGCSDAYLRAFTLKCDGKREFKPVREIKHHKTCILKTKIFKLHNKLLLITCTTRGVATLWEITIGNDMEDVSLNPFSSIPLHRSGINGLDCAAVSDSDVLVMTGGDDNTVQLSLLEVTAALVARVKYSWSSARLHCSQVTGARLASGPAGGPAGGLAVTAAADQRVALLRWRVAADGLACELVAQVFSDVADIQGVEVVRRDSSSLTICVFGKGIEVMSLPLPRPAAS